MICELLFPSSILAVKLNRKTLVIVLENEIYIYDISNMRLQHVIETPPNPEGELRLGTGNLKNGAIAPCEHARNCSLMPRPLREACDRSGRCIRLGDLPRSPYFAASKR